VDRGRRWLDRSYILCKIGQFDACLQEITKGLQLDSSPESVIWAAATVGSAIPNMPSKTAQAALVELSATEGLLPEEEIGSEYSIARTQLRGEILLARGDTKKALQYFRKASKQDYPLDAREYLERGLLAQAATETEPAPAADERIEALTLLERCAIRPVSVWRRFVDYPPGFAGDQMQKYVALARKTKHENDLTTEVARALLRLRPHLPEH